MLQKVMLLHDAFCLTAIKMCQLRGPKQYQNWFSWKRPLPAIKETQFLYLSHTCNHTE